MGDNTTTVASRAAYIVIPVSTHRRSLATPSAMVSWPGSATLGGTRLVSMFPPRDTTIICGGGWAEAPKLIRPHSSGHRPPRVPCAHSRDEQQMYTTHWRAAGQRNVYRKKIGENHWKIKWKRQQRITEGPLLDKDHTGTRTDELPATHDEPPRQSPATN